MFLITWTWDYLTIIYVVILLLGLIIGIKKGFTKSLFGFIGIIVALVAAILLAKPVGNWLFNQFGSGLTGTINNSLQAKDSMFAQQMPSDPEQQVSVLNAAFGAAGVPGILQGIVTKIVMALLPATIPADATVGLYLAMGLSSLSFVAIAFVLLFIIFCIVLAILKAIFKKIQVSFKLVGWLDKLLGAVIGIAFAFVIISVISYGVTFIVTLNNSVSTWFINQLKLNDDAMMTPAKWLYQINPIQWIFDKYL